MVVYYRGWSDNMHKVSRIGKLYQYYNNGACALTCLIFVNKDTTKRFCYIIKIITKSTIQFPRN